MLFDAVCPRTSTGGSARQQTLRHAKVATTMNIYVKMVSQHATLAKKLEANPGISQETLDLG
jgi:hypothetical protein